MRKSSTSKAVKRLSSGDREASVIEVEGTVAVTVSRIEVVIVAVKPPTASVAEAAELMTWGSISNSAALYHVTRVGVYHASGWR